MGFLAREAAAGAIEPVPAPVAAALIWGALVGLVKAAGAGALPLDDGVVDQSGRLMWRTLAREGGGE